jgi:hypothetical protein
MVKLRAGGIFRGSRRRHQVPRARGGAGYRVSAHLEWRTAPDPARKAARCRGASIVGVSVASPSLFLNFGTVLADVAHEARLTHLSATGEGLILNLLWYMRGPLVETLSIGGLILGGIGIVWGMVSTIIEKGPHSMVEKSPPLGYDASEGSGFFSNPAFCFSRSR